MSKRLIKTNGNTYQLDVVISDEGRKLMVIKTVCGSMQISASQSPLSSTKFRLKTTTMKNSFGGFYITNIRRNGEPCLSIVDKTLFFKTEDLSLFRDVIVLLHKLGIGDCEDTDGELDTIVIEQSMYERQKVKAGSFVILMDHEGGSNKIVNEDILLVV